MQIRIICSLKYRPWQIPDPSNWNLWGLGMGIFEIFPGESVSEVTRSVSEQQNVTLAQQIGNIHQVTDTTDWTH